MAYTMNDPEKPNSATSGAPARAQKPGATTKGHRDARAEALQKALRDNLRRRKAAASSVDGDHEKASGEGGDGA